MIHGRGPERQAVTNLLASARSGGSAVLVVHGEAGVGKSTLLRYATGHATGMRVLTSTGVQAEVKLAFSGLHQLLTPVLGHLDHLPEPQATALRGALALADAPASELVVAAAVHSLLVRVSTLTPLLLVVDDAHWLDPASAAALLFAARRMSTEPIAVLLAVRDHEHHHLDLTDLPQLPLAGLTAQEARGLLGELGWFPPDQVLHAVVEQTAGNPLALTELGRSPDPDHIVSRALLGGPVPVGSRLRQAYLRRVDRLPTASQDLLLLIAAEETGSGDTVLGAAARLGLSRDALDPAEHAHLIEIDHTHLRFRHPLMRAAVYQAASFRARAAAHHALADQLAHDGHPDRAVWHRALAALTPDEDLAAALEHTAEATERRGGSAACAAVLELAARISTTPHGRAARLVAAASAAWRSGQTELATSLVDQADTTPADPVTTVRIARLRGLIELSGGDPAAAYARLVHGADLIATATPAEAVSLLLVAADAAYHADRVEDAVRAGLRITELDCDHAHRRLGHWLVEVARGTLTAVGTGPWDLYQLLPDTLSDQDSRRWMWVTAISWLGPHQRQARAFALAAYERLRSSGMPGVLAMLLSWLADIEYHLGLWRAGEQHAAEGAALARATGQQTRLADFLALLAHFAAVRGDRAGCQRHAEQALAVALPGHNRAASANATWALGLAALTTGDTQQAVEHLSALGTPGSPYAHEMIARLATPDLVEAAVRGGHPTQAHAALAAFTPWATQANLPWAKAHLHRCHALLDDTAAEPHFHAATSAEHSQDRLFDLARTALSHGEWLRRNRQRGQARPRLRLAVDVFTSLGATPWTDRATAQLRACGGSPRRGPGQPARSGQLTAQEFQVAELAASGLSNREIGQRLSLSPRTVGYHLYNLFPKLGISARSQLRDLDLGDPPAVPH